MAPPRKQSATESDKTSSPLAQVAAALGKVFPKESSQVDIDEDSFRKSRPHIPTGSIVLDQLVGGRLNRYGIRPCPGLPRGGIVNLYGQESSGKTTLALTLSAQVCAMGGTVGYVDWENAVDVTYARTLGVPIHDSNRFQLYQPESMEKGLQIIWAMTKSGVDLIVIDSVGAGVPQARLDQSLVEKGKQTRLGSNASIWSDALPELRGHAQSHGSCILGISQLRDEINAMGYGAETTKAQGGHAWKFYSDVRIRLKRIAQEKGKAYNALTHKLEDTIVGQTVRAKLDKCKVSASQNNVADFYIRFGDGIDDLRSVVEIAANHGVVKKSGAWYSWGRLDGTVIKGCGMDEFKAQIKTNPQYVEELRKLAIDALSKAPDGTVFEEEPEDMLSDLDAILNPKEDTSSEEV